MIAAKQLNQYRNSSAAEGQLRTEDADPATVSDINTNASPSSYPSLSKTASAKRLKAAWSPTQHLKRRRVNAAASPSASSSASAPAIGNGSESDTTGTSELNVLAAYLSAKQEKQSQELIDKTQHELVL